MERVERLRRRREQYCARRNNETTEERESHSWKRERNATDVDALYMMSTQQQQMLLQQRREARLCSESIVESLLRCTEIPSLDDPFVVSKVSELIIICMDLVW